MELGACKPVDVAGGERSRKLSAAQRYPFGYRWAYSSCAKMATEEEEEEEERSQGSRRGGASTGHHPSPSLLKR